MGSRAIIRSPLIVLLPGEPYANSSRDHKLAPETQQCGSLQRVNLFVQHRPQLRDPLGDGEYLGSTTGPNETVAAEQEFFDAQALAAANSDQLARRERNSSASRATFRSRWYLAAILRRAALPS